MQTQAQKVYKGENIHGKISMCKEGNIHGRSLPQKSEVSALPGLFLPQGSSNAAADALRTPGFFPSSWLNIPGVYHILRYSLHRQTEGWRGRRLLGIGIYPSQLRSSRKRGSSQGFGGIVLLLVPSCPGFLVRRF